MESAQFITFRPNPTWGEAGSIKHEQHCNNHHLLSSSSSSSSSQSKYQSSSTSWFGSNRFLSQRVRILDDGSDNHMAIDSSNKGTDEEVGDRRSLHFARRRGYEDDEEEGRPRKRKRIQQQTSFSFNHDNTSQQMKTSPFEIDLVMSLIWECLTWREQLTCRQVAKHWKEFYPMAPTRLIIMTNPSRHGIPKVLQPSILDQTQQGVRLETFRRLTAICAADRDNNNSQGHYNSTPNTNNKPIIAKHISRLDLYIEAGGGTDVEDSLEKMVSSLIEHAGGVRELRLFLHATRNGASTTLMCQQPITTHTHDGTTWKNMTTLVIRHRQATRTYSRSTSSRVNLRFLAYFRNVAPNLRKVDSDGTIIYYNS